MNMKAGIKSLSTVCALVVSPWMLGAASAQNLEELQKQIDAGRKKQPELQRQAEERRRVGSLQAMATGVLRDLKTGLEWTAQDNGRDIDWDHAQAYCESRGGAWRLPSADELLRLYDRTGQSQTPCAEHTCNVSSLFQLSDAFFWSSDRQDTNPLYVNLVAGRRQTFPYGSIGRRALCARDPQVEKMRAGRFTVVRDGVLRDANGGAEWTQSDNGRDINWTGAQAYCQAIGKGWRLPSVDELRSIFDVAGVMRVLCGDSICKVSSNFRLTRSTQFSSDPNGPRGPVLFDLATGDLFSGRVLSRTLCIRR